MSSKKLSKGLDLDTDLPITQADVEALRRARRLATGLPPWKQVELLVESLPPAARVPNRKTCAGFEPFEL